MSKGSKVRPTRIPLDIRDLKHELWQKSTSPERKIEIKKELKRRGYT